MFHLNEIHKKIIEMRLRSNTPKIFGDFFNIDSYTHFLSFWCCILKAEILKVQNLEPICTSNFENEKIIYLDKNL